MSQIKVWKSPEVDDTTRLRLADDDHGRVSLFAVDKEGTAIHKGSILQISVEGLFLQPDVSNKLGFRTTEHEYPRIFIYSP